MIAPKLLCLTTFAVIIITFLLVGINNSSYTKSLQGLARPTWLGTINAEPHAHESIPNIVHFIFFTRPGMDVIELNLLGFLAMYSVAYHMPAAEVYFHTNATSDMIDRMKRVDGLKPPRFAQETTTVESSPAHVAKIMDPEYNEYWTQAVVNGIPNLKIMPITKEYSPTASGKHLETLSHWGDFARADIIYDYGGTTLDLDAIVVRDLAPLRNSGFRNILGKDGETQCAIMLAVPQSMTMKAYRDLMDPGFTPGNYYFHATSMLHEIRRTMATIPNEILMVSDQAFYPAPLRDGMGAKLWELRTQDMRSASQEFTASHLPSTTFNLDSYIKNFEVKGVDDYWQNLAGEFGMDFSETYVIHGVHSALRAGIENGRILDWSGTTPSRLTHGLTIPLIMEGNSNFARATLPMVQHALDRGVISL